MKQLTKLSVAMVAVFTVMILMFPSCDKVLDNPDNSNLNKGDTVWIYEIPEAEALSIPDALMAIGKNGDIYFEVRDVNNIDNPRVYAITKDGKFKWKTEPLDDNGLNISRMLNSAIVVADDGTLYCTSGPFLYSINPSNGQADKIWECPKTLEVDNLEVNAYSPLVNLCLTNDGNLVVQSFGTIYGFAAALYCITPDGQLKWLDTRKDPTAYNISIGPDGNIYDIAELWDESAQLWKPSMLVTSPDDGSILWTQEAFPDVPAEKPVFTSGGDVIFPLKQEENTLVRMETTDFSNIWSLKNYGGMYIYSVVDKNDNTFSSFFNAGNIYIPGNTTGDITSPENIYIPKYPNIDSKENLTGGQSDAFANIISSDKTGKAVWSYDKMGTNSMSVTISDDKVLYFSSFYDTETSKNRNRIFAIKWDASLEHSGWPRYTHDNRNTSNYNKW